LGDLSDILNPKQDVVIKPNLIEARRPEEHITTNPAVVAATIRAVRDFGVRKITIAEGSGHEKDSHFLWKVTGIWNVARKCKVRLVDLNFDDVVKVQLRKPLSLNFIYIPKTILNAKTLICIPKLKTHHWACVSLSLKTAFGLVPGSLYGFPKNSLHWACIPRAIVDINSIVKINLSIIDGIIGMQGNGPLDGNPIKTGLILASRDRVAVDAVATEAMSFSPFLIPQFRFAFIKNLGNIGYNVVGAPLHEVQKRFKAPPNLTWLEGKGLFSKEKLRDYILHDYQRDIQKYFHTQ
jgi:uncharacterized protein (DUF362 family)